MRVRFVGPVLLTFAILACVRGPGFSEPAPVAAKAKVKEAPPEAFAKVVVPFFSKHCISCQEKMEQGLL